MSCVEKSAVYTLHARLTSVTPAFLMCEVLCEAFLVMILKCQMCPDMPGTLTQEDVPVTSAHPALWSRKRKLESSGYRTQCLH